MTSPSTSIRWRGVAIAAALIILGSVAAASAKAGLEGGGRVLADELRCAAVNADWEAVERGLGRLEIELGAGEARAARDGAPPATRHLRIRRELRIGRPGRFDGHAAESWGEHWGHFGERAGRRFGRVGERIGERFNARGGDLSEAIELSVETVLDAVDTLLDSLDRR